MAVIPDEHRGRIWSVILDPGANPIKKCWFARGPRGFLLGGYRRDDQALDAVKLDQQDYDKEAREDRAAGSAPLPAWSTGLRGEDDPIELADDGEKADPEVPDDQTVWRLRRRNGAVVFVIEFADGNFSQLLESPEPSSGYGKR